jgi:SHS2 domain-containing protein
VAKSNFSDLAGYQDMQYKLIEHTADFGIHVFSDSEKQLFEDAALAMFEVIVEVQTPGECTDSVVSAIGNDRPELMVNWLRELLYLWAGQEKVLRSVSVGTLTPQTITARVALEPYDPDRHHVLNEIKAVTYHQIDVCRIKDHWETRIIFDV